MSDEFVYFAQAKWDEGVLVKIGYSKHPRWRKKELSSIHGREIELLVYVSGDKVTEATLHEMFKQYHAHGEWFVPKRKMYRLLAYCVEHSQLPAAVIEAAETKRAFIYAKRRHAQTVLRASQFFGEEYISGVTWPRWPLNGSKKAPDPFSSDWLPRVSQ